MNCNDEFVSEWNKIFPFKIRNVDLQKPTEKFLLSALECYLIQMYINIKKIRDAISSTDKTGQLRFKIDLCRYIDRLYKISDATNSFMYYDLVQPGKEKTIHLLKVLLNYFLYNRMVRDEVVAVSTAKIKEFESIKTTKNNVDVENENAKAHAVQFDTKLAELTETVSQLQTTVLNLQEDEAELINQIEGANTEFCTLKLAALDLWKCEQDLQAEVVSDSMLNEVENSTTEAEIQEAIESEHHALLHNQEVAGRLKHLHGCIESLQAAYNKFKDGALTSSYDLTVEQNVLQRQLEEIEVTCRALQSDIKTKTAAKSVLKEKILLLKDKLCDNTELKTLKDDHKNLLQIESALKEEIEKKKKALDDLEIERDFINENGPRVLEQISKDAL